MTSGQSQRFQLLLKVALLAFGLGTLPWLAGCDGYFDDEGEVVAGWCVEQQLNLLRPRRDSSDAYFDGWVLANLECAPAEATITLKDPGGDVVPANVELHRDGTQIRLRPVVPLLPETQYDARLDTSRRYDEWSFTTSQLGNPTVDPLPGRSLSVKPRTGLLLEPAGLDEIIDDLFLGFFPVLEFTHPPAGQSVPIRLGGRLAGTVQDDNQEVRDLPGTWNDPVWSLGPTELVWYLEGGELHIEQARISGAVGPLSDDGGGGIQIVGLWDPRPAVALLPVTLTDLCEMSVGAGGPDCVPCEDGEAVCVPLRSVHIDADSWAGSLDPNL